MSDELKPCPFCGGTDLYWPHGTDPAIIECGGKDGCGARSGVPDEQSRTEAITAWNRRADLAQAPAPVLWTQAQQLAFARAYDTEDAAQRGEPTPWVDGEDAGEWVDERVSCVRAGLAALDAPDAGGGGGTGGTHRAIRIRL